MENHTVWIGGNDLLNITGDPVPVVTNAVKNIAMGLTTPEMDIFTLMSDFIADNLFDNYQNMLSANPTSTDRYLFWDAIHPTTYAHGLIADEAFLAAAPVPIPSTIGLLCIGLLGLAGVNRRKK